MWQLLLCISYNKPSFDIDLKNPASNKKNAGFTKEERDGFTDLLTTGEDGLVDSFRHFYPDKKDAYTFWTYMGNARAKDVGWYVLNVKRFVHALWSVGINVLYNKDE